MSRKKFIIKRILQIIPMLLIASVLAFMLAHASRGEVANSILRSRGVSPTPMAVEAIQKELGLDRALPIQYLSWLKNAVRFDFGDSFITKKPVIGEILFRFPNTLLLAVTASILSVVFGILFALVSVRYRNRWIDHAIRILSTASSTLPNFVLGLVFLYFFAIVLHIAPVISASSIKNVFLPAATLAIPLAAQYTRLIRADLVDVMESDYIRTARAKGLSVNRAMFRHGLKNAVLPSITLIGSNLGYLLGGSFACESIFSWNGVGKFIFESVKSKDLPVIQAFIVIVSLTFILLNLIIDIIYIYIDPQIHLE